MGQKKIKTSAVWKRFCRTSWSAGKARTEPRPCRYGAFLGLLLGAVKTLSVEIPGEPVCEAAAAESGPAAGSEPAKARWITLWGLGVGFPGPRVCQNLARDDLDDNSDLHRRAVFSGPGKSINVNRSMFYLA